MFFVHHFCTTILLGAPETFLEKCVQGVCVLFDKLLHTNLHEITFLCFSELKVNESRAEKIMYFHQFSIDSVLSSDSTTSFSVVKYYMQWSVSRY